MTEKEQRIVAYGGWGPANEPAPMKSQGQIGRELDAARERKRIREIYKRLGKRRRKI